MFIKVIDYERLIPGCGKLTDMTHSTLPPAFVCLSPGRHNKDILNYLFHTACCSPSSQPSVGVGSISIHRISALFDHINELIVRASSLIMRGGSPVDGTSVMDDLTSLLRQLAEDRKE